MLSALLKVAAKRLLLFSTLFFFVGVAGAQLALAQAQQQEEADLIEQEQGPGFTVGDYARYFLFGELVFAGASYLAAESPETMGGALLLLGASVNKTSERSKIGSYVATGGWFVIGSINAFELSDGSKYDRDDIIRRNMVMWNIGTIALLATEAIARKMYARQRERERLQGRERPGGGTVSFSPLLDGAQVSFRYDF